MKQKRVKEGRSRGQLELSTPPPLLPEARTEKERKEREPRRTGVHVVERIGGADVEALGRVSSLAELVESEGRVAETRARGRDLLNESIRV